MGPELVAAILAPIFGGGMSLLIYFGKKNTDRIDRGFLNLTNGLQSIERTVQDLSLDVVKNYVSHDEMRAHEAQESIWHQHMEGEFNGLRNEVQDYKRIAHERGEKVKEDISEIKEMQWKMRLEALERQDKIRLQKDNPGTIDKYWEMDP